ncbi:MAG: TetR/AcrR family transcriptional regulator [Actinomycetota bacterium]
MARPLSQEARRKAIEAAQELIGEHGIGGCTLEAVAKRSGVAKTTLYRHWGSGDVLLIHSIDCLIERMPTPATGSLRGDLLELMSMFRMVANEPAHRQMMLELMAAATKDPELAAVHRSLMQERMRPLHDVVQRAIDQGEIPPIDLHRASEFIEGPMMAKMIKSGEPIRAEELGPMVDLIIRGLGASGKGPEPARVSAPDSAPATAEP